MSLTDLIPAPYRWVAYAVAAAALVAFGAVQGARFAHARDDAQITKLQHDWDAERAAQAKAVQAQRDRNIELQRAAERRYVVTQQTQTQFFTQAAKEIHDAAAPLAACPVPDAVRVRLNAAAACARGDSPAACGPAGEVPGP